MDELNCWCDPAKTAHGETPHSSISHAPLMKAIIQRSFRTFGFHRRPARRLPLLIMTAALAVASVRAATVGPSGYANSFDTQPLAVDFGSASRPGLVTDVYDMDADVNASISVDLATNRVVSSPLNPPGSIAQAAWSSTGRYLQLRPTGGRYTAL